MDIQTWKAMLERRGYKEVQIVQEGHDLHYSINGVIEGYRRASDFNRLTYKGLRKQIDDELGHQMVHVTHTCGCPLLKAPAGYTSTDPFHRVEEPLHYVQFYPVPVLSNSPSLLLCPQCGKVLQAKDVHRVKDPEVEQHQEG